MNIEEILRAPYTRIVRREPEGGYSAEVLEFPGCYSGGETADEADENLDEAMTLWVESELEQGHEIPIPIDPEQFPGRVTLRMAPTLHARAHTWAQREGISLNRLLTLAIANYMGDMSTPGAPPRRRSA